MAAVSSLLSLDAAGAGCHLFFIVVRICPARYLVFAQ